MLFDLRARGRRRTVKIVYTGLAILFGFGFVGFGVGTGGSCGGLFEGIFGNKEGGASAGFAANRSRQRKKARRRNPMKPPPGPSWQRPCTTSQHQRILRRKNRQVHRKRQAAARQGRQVVEPLCGTQTEQAEPHRGTADGDGVRPGRAQRTHRRGRSVAADNPRTAPHGGAVRRARAVRLPGKKHPRRRTGIAKTISLTPAADRAKVEAELTRIKKNPTGNPSNETYTSTTNGKTYNVKVGANGTGTGTKTKSTTPAPAKTK